MSVKRSPDSSNWSWWTATVTTHTTAPVTVPFFGLALFLQVFPAPPFGHPPRHVSEQSAFWTFWAAMGLSGIQRNVSCVLCVLLGVGSVWRGRGDNHRLCWAYCDSSHPHCQRCDRGLAGEIHLSIVRPCVYANLCDGFFPGCVLKGCKGPVQRVFARFIFSVFLPMFYIQHHSVNILLSNWPIAMRWGWSQWNSRVQVKT